MLFLPELSLLLAGLVLFFVSLGKPGSKKVKQYATGFCALTVIATLLSLKSEGFLFYGAFEADLFSQLFKLVISIGTLIVVLLGDSEHGFSSDARPEYYLFLFMSVLGLMTLVSSVEMLAIFISLELSSFAVYLMVPLRGGNYRSHAEIEAGIKYLLFGVMATGLMVFGMSYIFGLTGSTRLAEIGPQLATLTSQPAGAIAIILVLAGFFYKLALFPLHFWVPDVYEAASNETTAFIAAIPKLGAVALLIRICHLISPAQEASVNALIVCSLLSMFYGNLSALVQKDIKRLLGFSGISHAGFVLVGILTCQQTGYATAMYYIIGYVFMNLACFLVICTLSKSGENLLVDDFKGLHKRAPILAITLTISLFALAGIPPFVGFTGKFLLLLGALKQGHLMLVVFAAVNTAIAIYYYLSIVRVTYCTDNEERETVKSSTAGNILALSLVAIIVLMGVAPSTFISFTSAAIQSVM